MKEYTLEPDTNTIYFRTLSGLGFIIIGLSIGWTSFEIKHDMPVDWFNSISLLCYGILFGYGLPTISKRQSITINKDRIYTKGYTFHFGQKSSVDWDSIRSIRFVKGSFLGTSRIEIKNQIGSTEKISLPIHTKSQIIELKEYLAELSKHKNLSVEGS
jgi:hypothetical protein